MTKREKFEAWWESEGYDKKLTYANGLMFNRIKENMFVAYKAALKESEQQQSVNEVRALVWIEAKALAKSAVASDSIDHIDFLFDGKAAQLRQGGDHE